MTKYLEAVKRHLPLMLALIVGLSWLFIGSLVWSMEAVQLNNLEVHPLPQNKVQIMLEFSRPIAVPTGFSIDHPPSIVFDFPGVSNQLPKGLWTQKFDIGMLKGMNIIEANNRTRVVIDLSRTVPYDSSLQGNVLNIVLEENIAIKPFGGERLSCLPCPYEIRSVDFRRGEHGEGRLIVSLSNPKAAIDFKENGGKISADFRRANISSHYTKRYDVADFGTPIQSFTVERKGDDVEIDLNTVGDYDKIAYQMDNEFIIEVRAISKEEKNAMKALSGQYTGERISLNFQDVEIRAALQIIADFSGFNLIASDSVTGNITLRLQNVPWDQALDIILKTKNLDKRKTGNIMLVGPSDEIAAREKKELEAQKQLAELGTLRSEMIQINYAKAEDLAAMLKEKGNSLMTARGTVTIDKRTNTLLVQDIENKLAEVREFIKKLDIPIRQVEISTQIVTANKALEETLGFRFGGGANATLGHRQLGIGSSIGRSRAIASSGRNTPAPNAVITPQPLASGVTPPSVNNTEGLFSDLVASNLTNFAGTLPSLGFSLARMPHGTLIDLELEALEYETKTKTIARPKLTTLDQTKASVEQGVEIPYQEASSSGATSVSFKKAVLRLEVTPQITPDDKVTMDLSISSDTRGAPVNIVNTNVAGAGATVASMPTINTNRLETKVLVDNGETIVLGGILSVTDTKNRAKVPFFGDIPFIGALFRNKYTLNQQQELLIFITPRIIMPMFCTG